MTGKALLEKLKETCAEIQYEFRFPYAYIRCKSLDFEGKDDDDREQLICDKMAISVAETRKTAIDCMFTLQWMTPKESEDQPMKEHGYHWLRAFIEDSGSQVSVDDLSNIVIVHFYGYKGGQGRSTVLACLAQKLALEGTRVLVLDADIEAPSLDILFGVKSNGPNSTLLGIVQKKPSIAAVPALQGQKGGEVRLIACRPRDPKYDIDFAAFALQTGLLPELLVDGISRIKKWAIEQGFDVILVDHRSGMSMTTLTWMQTLSGPTAVFTKLDEQWRGAETVIQEILNANPGNPGVIVTFKPDDETEDSFRRRTVRQRTDLLSLLGTAIAKSAQVTAEDDEDIGDPSNVEDHWILWPYDQAFRPITLPDAVSLGVDTKTALGELTRLLEIPPPRKSQLQTQSLSGIGSKDQGDLIQTAALTSLRQPNNSIRYIFGRKGTGKTRLATELAREEHGEALLVDANNQDPAGITTADSSFTKAKQMFQNDREGLWWAILLAALQDTSTERNTLRTRLETILQNQSLCNTSSLIQNVLNKLPMPRERIFLFDGIETAFTVADIYLYIENLFSFMNTLQSDDKFVGNVSVKVFLRTDLASRSVQNFEQQVENRVIYLFWDYKKIMNFLLSRLPEYSYFKSFFPDTIAEIQGMLEKIRLGEVDTEESERLILQIFPKKMARFNILTTTFLRLHFADSSSSSSQSEGESYYPRVIYSFLNDLNSRGDEKGEKSVLEERIDQQLIVLAHEKASADYMDQIKQELRHLLNFKVASEHENQLKLEEWINAFARKITPFDSDEMEQHLATETHLGLDVVRPCLDQMRVLGIFERTLENPKRWKTGRLFKFSLKMKFNRSKGDLGDKF